MSKTETQDQWAQIRALVEKALETGLDTDCWQDIQEAVSKHEAREAAGPLFESFEAQFLKEGIAPEIARRMAEIASQPSDRY